MVVSSRHADKRIYALLLLIVAMLIGMYVISFKKVTTSSQAASSADQTCIDRSGDPNAYCQTGLRTCRRSGYKITSYTCNLRLGNCCISTGGAGLGGGDLDVVCRRKSGKSTAYCNGFEGACGPGFTKQGSCGLVFSCCVPNTVLTGIVTVTPTPIPQTGTIDADCGATHIDCRRNPATPKCINISLVGAAIYRCVPQDFRTSPTPRPTAGTIAPNNVCPPPVVNNSGVRTCQTQGYRWGPTQNGAKTCYSICGNLYSTYCGNARLVDSNGNNVTPCCGEALSKPFLFSKVCCDKLNPNDIKSALGESEAKKNCPNVVF